MLLAAALLALLACGSVYAGAGEEGKAADNHELSAFQAGYRKIEFSYRARDGKEKTCPVRLWYPTASPAKEIKYAVGQAGLAAEDVSLPGRGVKQRLLSGGAAR